MTITANQNALAFIRSLQVGQLNGITPADCGPWRDVIDEAARAFEQAGPEAAMRVIAAAPELMRLASADEAPRNPWHTFDLLPDLPNYARLSPAQERQAQDSSLYLNTYVEYGSALVPMLPPNFHESAALYLGAVAIARRLKLEMGYEVIHPNLYLLWVAVTTLFNKSTGLAIPRRFVNEVMPHLRLTSEFSREAFIDSLSGRPPANQNDLNFSEESHRVWQLSLKFAARRGIILDEASSLFTGLKREFNTGMAELFMHLYDGNDYDRETKGGGLVRVKKPYVSFLGATTPVMLKNADNVQLWLSGFWPRFNHLLPRALPTRLIEVDTIPNEPDILTAQLDRLANRFLPTPPTLFDFPEAHCVLLPAEVHQAHRLYRRALMEGILMSSNKPPVELFGVYGRLPTLALKVAIILAAFDWDGDGNAPTIRLAHWWKAQQIAESWREGAHLFYRDQNDVTELDSLEKRIVYLVSQRIASNGEVTRRDVYRALSKKAFEVNPLIDEMLEAGLIKEITPAGSRKKLLLLGDGLHPDFVRGL